MENGKDKNVAYSKALWDFIENIPAKIKSIPKKINKKIRLLYDNHAIVSFFLEVSLICVAIWFHYLVVSKDEVSLWHVVIFAIIASVVVAGNAFWAKSVRKRHLQYNVKLRYCLTNMKRLFVRNSQRIYDIYDAGGNNLDRESIRRFFIAIKRQVVRMIFYQVSDGNTNMIVSYRVALFEIDENDNLLKVVTYFNRESLRPRIASLNKGFKIGQGIVGLSWYLKREMFIKDVMSHLRGHQPKYYEIFQNIAPDIEIGDHIPHTSDHYVTKSIICIPVVIRKYNDEIIKAVVSIDCNKEEEFDMRDDIVAKKLRSVVYPYIRFLALLYSSVDFVGSQTNIDIKEKFPIRFS